MCCAGMALSQWQHTLWGNCWIYLCYMGGLGNSCHQTSSHLISQTPCPNALASSPMSITAFTFHSAPIFRLLLKVAVNGTHQCDFHNFWGALCSNCTTSIHTSSIQLGLPHPTHCKNAEGKLSQSLASPCHTPLS